MIRKHVAGLVMVLIVFVSSAHGEFVQNSSDDGAADTVVFTYTIEESETTGQYDLHLDLFVSVDADSLSGVAFAFGWDDPRVTVADAAVTAQAASDLSFLSMAYRANELDSSNFYKQIVFVGLRGAMPGLDPEAGRQHLASYNLVLSDWTAEDTFVMDTSFCISFTLMAADNKFAKYTPYWGGPLAITPSTSCCVQRVGDANGIGGDEPTIGDMSVIVDALFISGYCEGIIACLAEADLNLSGGADPACSDITIGDFAILQDYLFITGQSLGLNDCY